MVQVLFDNKFLWLFWLFNRYVVQNNSHSSFLVSWGYMFLYLFHAYELNEITERNTGHVGTSLSESS